MKRRKVKAMSLILGMSCMIAFSGCSKKETNVKTEKIPKETPVVTPKKEKVTPTPTAQPVEPQKKTIDLSKEFKGINGCAVIYDPEKSEYSIYNQSMCEVQESPYSTFKIVSTLIGLKNGVLKDENSHMKYNHRKYQMNIWNKDLTLKEAVEVSCVWYFRQVIDGVGQEETKRELTSLKFGNCNVSEWKGNGMNEPEDLNGFWLNSSLKISPMEQAQVMTNIFEGKTEYTKEQIEILKNVMLKDKNNGFDIYGKTGTGRGQGWYTGFAEKNDKKLYFAIYLEDKKPKSSLGPVARKIMVSIVNQY